MGAQLGDDSRAGLDPRGWLGSRIRSVRHTRGISQRDLAEAAGISESFLRRVEAGGSDLAVARLLAIAAALGTTPSQLLEHADSINVSRPEERVPLPLPDKGVEGSLLFANGVSSIEPAIFVLAPGAGTQTPLRHRGREFIYVLQGEVGLELPGAYHQLSAGTAADYESTQPHHFRNPSQTHDAAFLIIDN